MMQESRRIYRYTSLILALSFCISVASFSAISTSTSSRPSDLSLPGDSSKLRYRCRVTYDGTNLCGFQFQDSDKRTVQGELEQVLSQRFDRAVRVVPAGRTDAGVHARGQAIHFDLGHNETEVYNSDWNQRLQTSMNQMLPSDIRIWNVGPAPPPCSELVNGDATGTIMYAWNVNRKCSGKLYSYRLCLADCMDPIERHRRWQLDWENNIDPVYLAELLKHYQGTHDFQCFAGALEATARKTGVVMSTLRTIQSIELIEEDPVTQFYRVDIYLDGALYKMVRNIVGTALDVCRGALPESQFLELLNNPTDMARKDNPSKPAPPQGLTMERVFYPNDDF
jgi:tRNA pseudouridine38-40 synthase